jgi:hypothetical protein
MGEVLQNRNERIVRENNARKSMKTLDSICFSAKTVDEISDCNMTFDDANPGTEMEML